MNDATPSASSSPGKKEKKEKKERFLSTVSSPSARTAVGGFFFFVGGLRRDARGADTRTRRSRRATRTSPEPPRVSFASPRPRAREHRRDAPRRSPRHRAERRAIPRARAKVSGEGRVRRGAGFLGADELVERVQPLAPGEPVERPRHVRRDEREGGGGAREATFDGRDRRFVDRRERLVPRARVSRDARLATSLELALERRAAPRGGARARDPSREALRRVGVVQDTRRGRARGGVEERGARRRARGVDSREHRLRERDEPVGGAGGTMRKYFECILRNRRGVGARANEPRDGLEVVLPRRRLKRRVERALGRAFARAFHRHRERVARVAERFQSAPPGLPRFEPQRLERSRQRLGARDGDGARGAIDLGVRGGHGDRRDRAVGPDARVLLRVAREALDRGGARARGERRARARRARRGVRRARRRSHPGRTRTARGRRVRRGGAPRRPSARCATRTRTRRGARGRVRGSSGRPGGSAAIATACASSARSRARAKRCASQLAHRGGSPGGGVAPPEARRADARWEAIVASISSSAAIAGWSDAAAAMRIVEDERRTRSADQEARGMSDRIRIPLERFAPRFRFRSRRGTRRASRKGGALVGASSRESRRRLATPWGGRGRV